MVHIHVPNTFFTFNYYPIYGNFYILDLSGYIKFTFKTRVSEYAS